MIDKVILSKQLWLLNSWSICNVNLETISSTSMIGAKGFVYVGVNVIPTVKYLTH